MKTYTYLHGLEYSRNHTTKCLINGEIVNYDACHEGDLKRATDFYGNAFQYIGSGHIYYINNVENHFKNLAHFFTRKKS